jgi:hypothetical protein
MWDDVSNKRLKRLKKLLERIENGENVAPRDLKQWLTQEQIERWENHNEMIKNENEMYGERPSEFDSYVRLLWQADFAYNNGEGISGRAASKGKQTPNSIYKIKKKAESLYERALENLEEILTRDQELKVWLDRDVDFSFENHPSPEPLSVPRLKKSKSEHVEGGYEAYKSDKRSQFHEAKRTALFDAIEEIENPPASVQNVESIESGVERLKEMKKLIGR